MSSGLLLVLLPSVAFANQLGAVGYSGKQGDTCNRCHSGGAAPTVTLTGPATLTAGQSASYTLSISGGAGVRAGMNVAASVAEAQLLPGGADTTAFSGELHHSSPKAFASGRATFTFTLQAPPFAGPVRLFAAGNSCNGNGGDSGDRAGMATLDVTVTGGATAPRIATAPAASPEVVKGKTTALTVLGADDGGEAGLTYTWSVASGPGAVTFAPNGTNAAKASTATFSSAGTYLLQVRAEDASGEAAAASVEVTVESTFAGFKLSPSVGQVLPRATKQFSAQPVDQFGVAVTTSAEVTWSTTGGGSISPTGLFTAGASLGGPHVVQALASDKAGSATITIVSRVEEDATAPVVSLLSPRPGATLVGTVTLEAAAADEAGVTRVELRAGDATIGSATAAPWRITVDTTTLPDGLVTLTAVAFDPSGNAGTSDAVDVVIGNAGEVVRGGCAAAPGVPLVVLAALLARRRRRVQ